MRMLVGPTERADNETADSLGPASSCHTGHCKRLRWRNQMKLTFLSLQPILPEELVAAVSFPDSWCWFQCGLRENGTITSVERVGVTPDLVWVDLA